MLRSEISRRLKAGRWLAGGVDSKGRPKALTNGELAQIEVLLKNGITKNRLDEIEQRKITPPPMELEKISAALGLGSDWFSDVEPLQRATPDALEVLLRALQDLGLVPPPEPGPAEPDEPDTDPPGG